MCFAHQNRPFITSKRTVSVVQTMPFGTLFCPFLALIFTKKLHTSRYFA